jgi:hypothetical protein
VRALIKFAPILTLERQNDPAWNRPGRFLYRSDSLRLLPTSSAIPLLVDHVEEREIGYVEKIMRLEDTDGPWFMARAVVSDPPGWLKKGTAASFASPSSSRSLFSEDLVCNAFVTEISLLSPGVKRAEPLAKVVVLERTDLPVARATPDRHAAAGEVIHHSRREVLVRPGIGQVLGVR